MRRLAKTLLVLAAIAVGLVVLTFLTMKPYRMPSSGMEPSFHCARPAAGCQGDSMDRILVSRFTYRFRDPHRGDVVVFKTPPQAALSCGSGGTFVKRLIALPGEHWRERNGFIYINGKKLDEPYVKPDRRDQMTIPEKTVPPGQYLMLGDNRSQSCDSRRWGPVPRKNLIGPVSAVYWPLSRIGFR